MCVCVSLKTSPYRITACFLPPFTVKLSHPEGVCGLQTPDMLSNAFGVFVKYEHPQGMRRLLSPIVASTLQPKPCPKPNWAHYVGSSTPQISQALAAFRAFSYVLHPSAQSTHLNSPILTCWPLPLLVAAPPTGAPVWTDPPLSLVLKGEFEFQKIKRGVLSLRVLMIRILGFYIGSPSPDVHTWQLSRSTDSAGFALGL